MGPDFICVGMPKAGTGWLFDQLQHHPDFWMTPLKGLHYLDHQVPMMKNAVRKLRRTARPHVAGRLGQKKDDARAISFLREAASLGGKPRNLAGYRSLFRHKENLLSGDITAPYYALSEEVIAEIGE